MILKKNFHQIFWICQRPNEGSRCNFVQPWTCTSKPQNISITQYGMQPQCKETRIKIRTCKQMIKTLESLCWESVLRYQTEDFCTAAPNVQTLKTWTPSTSQRMDSSENEGMMIQQKESTTNPLLTQSHRQRLLSDVKELHETCQRSEVRKLLCPNGYIPGEAFGGHTPMVGKARCKPGRDNGCDRMLHCSHRTSKVFYAQTYLSRQPIGTITVQGHIPT